jgi:hypothetical protein
MQSFLFDELVEPAAEDPVSVPQLLRDWETWILENILAGIDEAKIASALTAHGVLPSLASEEVRRIRQHPLAAAAERPAQHLRKLQSLLAIRSALARTDPAVNAIERRAGLSRAQFLRRYYAPNKPVILTGLLEHSKATQRWTPEYIAEACGDMQVEVMAGRDADPRYEIKSDVHRTTTTLSRYIEEIVAAGPSNDRYLVANNHFFDHPDAKVLLTEVPPLPEYLDLGQPKGRVFFWFGPAGTVTPLHHDVMNVLVAMIRGRKRFTLFSPDETPLLYNDIAVYSEVDPENPDFERHPLFRHAHPIVVDVEAGEVLFLPVGWWHHVRSLDLSMMVSYTCFVFANDFTWAHPSLEPRRAASGTESQPCSAN